MFMKPDGPSALTVIQFDEIAANRLDAQRLYESSAKTACNVYVNIAGSLANAVQRTKRGCMQDRMGTE